MKNDSKFSKRFLSVPTIGLITETPGRDGFGVHEWCSRYFLERQARFGKDFNTENLRITECNNVNKVEAEDKDEADEREQ